jgi:hypothetical protein
MTFLANDRPSGVEAAELINLDGKQPQLEYNLEGEFFKKSAWGHGCYLISLDLNSHS